MKLDLYTKGILTVIAVCLTINILKDFDFIPKAYAGEPLKKEQNLSSNKNYALVPVNADGTIDVNIKSSTIIDTNIKSSATTIDTNLKEVSGYGCYGKVPVVIKER